MFPSWGHPAPANLTLLNLLGLLDRPSSGVYRLDGGNVTDLSDEQQARVRSEKIGFVFQAFIWCRACLPR